MYQCINQIYKFAIVLAAVIGVFFIVIAGYVYMSADGNSESVDKAKSILESTITSLVILLAGYVLLNSINPDLVQFHGNTLQPVTINVAPGTGTGTTGGGTPGGGATGGGTGTPGLCSNAQSLCQGTTPDASCTSTCNNYTAQIQQAIQIGGISISGANAAPLIQAVMYAESRCSSGQTSSAGSCGLMQLAPATASKYKNSCGASSQNITCAWLNDPSNSVASICMGGKYLQDLSNGICGSNLENTIAGYNGGSGGSSAGACTPTVDCPGLNSCGGGAMEAWECPYSNTAQNQCDSGFAETRSYVSNVLGCYNSIK